MATKIDSGGGYQAGYDDGSAAGYSNGYSAGNSDAKKSIYDKEQSMYGASGAPNGGTFASASLAVAKKCKGVGSICGTNMDATANANYSLYLEYSDNGSNWAIGDSLSGTRPRYGTKYTTKNMNANSSHKYWRVRGVGTDGNTQGHLWTFAFYFYE